MNYRNTGFIKRWFLFLCCTSTLIFVSAQDKTGTIKGKVVTSDNQPASSVTVVLKGADKNTIAEDGVFEFRRILPGTYTLQISLVGFESIEETVYVAQNKTATVSFKLTASNKQLEEIIVTSGRNKLAKKESNYVARMPLKNLENPQVYSVINSKLIEQQVLTNFDDALKSAAGVVSGGSSPGTRSYSYLRGFDEQAFFRNGKMLGNWTENDMANIENIEVIKGPSGTLFGGHGRANYGGVVNRITKRPYDRFGGNITLFSGNNAYNRFTVDVNSPLNKDSSLLARVNAAYRKEKSFQDYGWAESYFVAPAFTYNINKRLKIVAEADFFSVKGADRGLINSAGWVTNVKQLNNIHNLSFTSNEILNNKKNTTFSVDAIYQINSKWTSTTSYGYSHSDYDYNYVGLEVANDSMINRGLGTARYDIDFTSIQQYFNGDFNIGKMRNRLLAGIDYLRDDEIYVGGNAAYDVFNYRKVAPYISLENFENALNVSSWTGGSVNDRYSIYASDVLDITNRLHVMASLRYEYSKEKSPDATLPDTDDPNYSFSQGAWTPKLGIVYELLPNELSVFGNYMGGTKNINSFLADDGSGNGKMQRATPEKATQWEVGIKSDLFDHKLSLMASYFNIKVDNKLRTNPNNQLFNLQDGTQANKGFEFELFANPVTGFDIMVGYANLNATFLNGSDAGKRPSYTPANTLNYWLSYTIRNGNIKGLGAGIGGNYRSDSYLGSDNTVVVPAVHTMNATVFYDQPRYRISVKSDNLTNEVYWGDYFNPQMLRAVKVALSFKF